MLNAGRSSTRACCFSCLYSYINTYKQYHSITHHTGNALLHIQQKQTSFDFTTKIFVVFSPIVRVHTNDFMICTVVLHHILCRDCLQAAYCFSLPCHIYYYYFVVVVRVSHCASHITSFFIAPWTFVSDYNRVLPVQSVLVFQFFPLAISVPLMVPWCVCVCVLCFLLWFFHTIRSINYSRCAIYSTLINGIINPECLFHFTFPLFCAHNLQQQQVIFRYYFDSLLSAILHFVMFHPLRRIIAT